MKFIGSTNFSSKADDGWGSSDYKTEGGTKPSLLSGIKDFGSSKSEKPATSAGG